MPHFICRFNSLTHQFSTSLLVGDSIKNHYGMLGEFCSPKLSRTAQAVIWSKEAINQQESALYRTDWDCGWTS